jgi:hypothetical protein|tara:strand:- start:297 stop:1805 length:1509 start_codon:yes stop_codon:yes gene_type:complete
MNRFKEIFTGLERAHGVTFVDKKGVDGEKIKGKSFVKREPVTDNMWLSHLQGREPSLGIIPINDENKCIWGCIDIDSYAGFDHQKLINKIKLLKLPLVVFRSKSGGAHVFCFTTVPVTAQLMRDKLLSVSAVLGYGGSEVFPKQVELKSEEDTGNFLNLPYFNGDNTTRYAFRESGDGATMEDFYELYERNKLTPEKLETLEIKRPLSEFSDGPPCIESLTQTKLNDGRDRVIYQYIQYAKRKWPEDWHNRINQFNYKYFENPLDDKTIQDKIKFHAKKDLGFKCNEEPMCNHCDKKLCRSRQFGIGGESIFPELSDLQKVELDEPYYWVNVDGERVKLDNIDCLMDQRLFRRTVTKQINKKPSRIKQNEFDKYVDLLLAGVEIVKAPQGSSILDQLQDHLEEFCTNRTAKSTTKEDILRGNVWTNEGKHHFIFSKFFHGYLQRKKWGEKAQPTQQMLKEHCDCKDDRLIIGKKRPSVMIVNAFERPEHNYTQKKLKEEAPF